jgi:hypothetical protein
MLHFSLASGGVNPITDDQGESGIPIFDGVLFDGTAGVGGTKKDILLYLFNDDNTYQYNNPALTVTSAGPTVTPSWFLMLDDSLIAGVSPTEEEWALYGIPGTGSLVLKTVSNSGGATPQVLMWLRAMVPDGTATANLSGAKLKVSAVQEAV